MSNQPIIIGGLGHSGTRIFAEILDRGGINMGINHLTRAQRSKDIHIRDLYRRWNRRYLSGGLTAQESNKMQRDFVLRLRMFFPFRIKPWGFKNPRTILILPFFHQIFPDMRFIHVVRDGRDMSCENQFVHSRRPASYITEEEEATLSPEKTMMLFWGRANQRAETYGRTSLGNRYLMVRFEDLCNQPEVHAKRILEFANCGLDKLDTIQGMVKKPSSIGRWKSADPELMSSICKLGEPYLRNFRYIA